MPVPAKKLAALVEETQGKKPQFPPKAPKGPKPPKGEKVPPPKPPKDEPKIDVDEIADKIEMGEGDEELTELMDGYDPEEDGNPPSWVADEDVWAKAKEQVDPEGEGDKYDDPWAVVAHVYDKMGGTRK